MINPSDLIERQTEILDKSEWKYISTCLDVNTKLYGLKVNGVFEQTKKIEYQTNNKDSNAKYADEVEENEKKIDIDDSKIIPIEVPYYPNSFNHCLVRQNDLIEKKQKTVPFDVLFHAINSVKKNTVYENLLINILPTDDFGLFLISNTKQTKTVKSKYSLSNLSKLIENDLNKFAQFLSEDFHKIKISESIEYFKKRNEKVI